MSRLVSLKKILVLGDYLTVKAIAGRMSEGHVHARITIGDAPELDPLGLTEALQAEYCQWESIKFYTFGNLPVSTGNGEEEGNRYSVSQLAQLVSVVVTPVPSNWRPALTKRNAFLTGSGTARC